MFRFDSNQYKKLVSVPSRFCNWLLNADIISVRSFGYSGLGSTIQDHSDHGVSKEPMNP